MGISGPLVFRQGLYFLPNYFLSLQWCMVTEGKMKHKLQGHFSMANPLRQAANQSRNKGSFGKLWREKGEKRLIFKQSWPRVNNIFSKNQVVPRGEEILQDHVVWKESKWRKSIKETIGFIFSMLLTGSVSISSFQVGQRENVQRQHWNSINQNVRTLEPN